MIHPQRKEGETRARGAEERLPLLLRRDKSVIVGLVSAVVLLVQSRLVRGLKIVTDARLRLGVSGLVQIRLVHVRLIMLNVNVGELLLRKYVKERLGVSGLVNGGITS